jgi:hypothetical protein
MATMKNIITSFLLALLAMMAGGCNDWLAVSPLTEKEKDEMLSTRKGFEDALTGLYINMIENDAYGQNLSFYMIEAAASLYDLPSSTHVISNIRLHQWSNPNVERMTNAAFARLYKVIANANALLEDIDANHEVFDSVDSYNWIKGEALAIRAMCHLDLLRLFGPVPSEANDSKILPYVTKFGHEPTLHSTWDEYCTLLLRDLSEAEQLLENDPLRNYSVNDIASPNAVSSEFKTDNTFFAYRFYRFNYYAVKALYARANLWMGNTTEAATAARAVISARNSDGSEKFVLGSATSMANNDLTLTSEHLMALYDYSLVESYDNYLANAILYKGYGATQYIKPQLYGNSGVDIREPQVGKWWIDVPGAYYPFCVCNKFFTDESTNPSIGMCIPLLRLAEMYLIVAEAAPIPEAQEYYDTFLRSRGLASVALTEGSRAATLRMEYMKEFYGEGYMFYTYKRMNSPRTDILWANSALTTSYVIPLPKTELTYTEE